MVPLLFKFMSHVEFAVGKLENPGLELYPWCSERSILPNFLAKPISPTDPRPGVLRSSTDADVEGILYPEFWWS